MARKRISIWLDGVLSAAPWPLGPGGAFIAHDDDDQKSSRSEAREFEHKAHAKTESDLEESFYSLPDDDAHNRGSDRRSCCVAQSKKSGSSGVPACKRMSRASQNEQSARDHEVNSPRHPVAPSESISCAGWKKPAQSGGAQHHKATAGIQQPAPALPPRKKTETNDSPTFKPTSPSHNVEMAAIKSVPLEKLPKSYKPEPQNGTIAWLHAATGFLVVFNCWGIGNAFGLFQAYYETIYLPGARPSDIAWIGSTQLALVFGLGVPVGRLVDKGYFRHVFHTGSVIMVIGLFCTAWCTRLWQLWLVQGLLTGIGMGMLFCSGMVAMMTWFDERHMGGAMGLAAAGSCIGGIVYVLVARHCLLALGFATTMRILGAVAAVTMIPANVVFRVRAQRKKHLRSSLSTAKIMQAPMPATIPTWRSMIDPAYVLAAAGMFFAFLALYFGFVYIISYASQVLHLSTTASTNLLIFMLAANLPGRFLPALLSDKCIGPLNTLIPSVLLSSAVIWLWAAGDNNQASLTVIACFYGFVSAGVQVLYAPAVYSFCVGEGNTAAGADKASTDRIGVKAGGIFTCIGLACLIGTPIGGALISYRRDRGMDRPYLGAQIFAGSCMLLAAVLLLASRVVKAGWSARRV